MQHHGSRNIIGIRDKYSIWMGVYSLFKDYNAKDLHLITMNSVSGNRLSLYRDDGIGILTIFVWISEQLTLTTKENVMKVQRDTGSLFICKICTTV